MLDMMKESISLIGLEKIIIKNFFKIFGIFGHFFYQSFGILFRKQIIEVLLCSFATNLYSLFVVAAQMPWEILLQLIWINLVFISGV